jgi:hypothetical protein
MHWPVAGTIQGYQQAHSFRIVRWNSNTHVRPLQEGCNQDQTCVPHRACAPPRRNKARVKAEAQPGMAGAIAGRLGRVCLAYSARYPRLPVEECGGRGAAFGDLAQIEASSCGSRSDRNLRGLTRRVDCTHFRPWPTMGT